MPAARKKKIFRFLVVFLLVAFVHVGGAQADKKYREEGVTVALLDEWKPYSYVGADGQAAGLLVDFWDNWSRKTGVPVQYVTAPWKDTISLVASGECDIHSGMFLTKDRQQFLDFSRQVYPIRDVLAILSEKVEQCDEILPNARIGLIDGAYSEKFLRQMYPEATIVPYGSYVALVGGLKKGEIDIVNCDYPGLVFTGSQLGLSGKISVCNDLSVESLHAAVRKGDTALLEILNDGLSRITKEDVELMSRRWFVRDGDKHNWPLHIMIMAALLSLVGIIVFFWSSRSK